MRAGEPPVSEYILVPDQLEEESDTAGELGRDGEENIVMLPVGEYQTNCDATLICTDTEYTV